MWENVKGMLALPDDPSQNAAARQGLLAAGAALLGGRGDLGGILGDGLMAGSQGYHAGLAQQQQTALRQAQMQQTQLENQKLQAEASRASEVRSIASGLGRSSGAGAPALQPGSSVDGAAPQIRDLADLPRLGQANNPRAAGQAAPVNMTQQAFDRAMQLGMEYSNAGYLTEAQKQFDLAEKLRPKVKDIRAMSKGDKRVMVQTFEDGRPPQELEYAPDLEKLVFADNGGTYNGRDAFTGEIKSTSVNSISPEARASIEQRERERRSAEVRVRTGAAPVGYRWTTQGNLEPIPGGPVAAKISDPQQRLNDANSVVELLDMASPLIGTSTNSYIGAAWDETARAVGKSTSGAQSAAQLKAIEGMLISKMPKMSGPQSDKDVLLYRQMAGQIGDRTIPEETKLAAMQTIREINAKYLEGAGVKVPPAPGTVKNGYQFLGGNPADQKSWRKMQ